MQQPIRNSTTDKKCKCHNCNLFFKLSLSYFFITLILLNTRLHLNRAHSVLYPWMIHSNSLVPLLYTFETACECIMYVYVYHERSRVLRVSTYEIRMRTCDYFNAYTTSTTERNIRQNSRIWLKRDKTYVRMSVFVFVRMCSISARSWCLAAVRHRMSLLPSSLALSIPMILCRRCLSAVSGQHSAVCYACIFPPARAHMLAACLSAHAKHSHMGNYYWLHHKRVITSCELARAFHVEVTTQRVGVSNFHMYVCTYIHKLYYSNAIKYLDMKMCYHRHVVKIQISTRNSPNVENNNPTPIRSSRLAEWLRCALCILARKVWHNRMPHDYQKRNCHRRTCSQTWFVIARNNTCESCQGWADKKRCTIITTFNIHARQCSQFVIWLFVRN